LELHPDEAERVVPPLLLLPLVENALKHAFRPKPGPCALRVEARSGRLQVIDDGVGRAEDAPDGVGLRTVRQRLEAMGATFQWLEVAQGCAVEITWP
jgi:signal transduction histidine kinase